MADVNLPLVGGVSRKGLLIGGGAAVAVVAFLYLRKRKSSGAAAAATATDTTGQAVGYDANGNPVYSDGTTGAYTDPGLQDTSYGPTYGQGGYYDPNAGQWIYGSSGTGQAAATTNQEWAQLAEQYLTQNTGADPAALSAALGKYLTGKAVTSAEEGLIDQAIAVEGYPPVPGTGGYPPGIRTQQAGGGDVTVPHVTGEKAGAAHNAIARAGLKPIADPWQRSADIVTSTTPAGGEQVPKGTEVLITAHAEGGKPPGPGDVEVPHVEGKTAGEAHNAIVHAGLVPTAPRGQKPRQRVRSTTPGAGTKVPRHSRVRINT